MGFLELDEELALDLPTRVLLGKAGAHGPCSHKPARSQPACCRLRGVLRSQTEACSPRANTHHRQKWLSPNRSSKAHVLTTVKAQPPPAGTGQPQNSAMQLTCYKEQRPAAPYLQTENE